MFNLAKRIENLQKQIGGIRIPLRYENTFGHTVFEEQNISQAPLWQIKIFSELIFAHRLSANKGGEYDEIISKALESLEQAVNRTGVINVQDAERAEELLNPIKNEAKSYKVILAAHAHIDMNWMWSWHETVASTLDTFRTMLKLMEEYPDFTFSQSQGAVYKIVEDFDPLMMQQIKQRISEGRWEVTASTWVENDQNMPSERSFIAHNYYTKKYLAEAYDVDPESLCIDFCPDTFGHNINMPEIMENGEVKYMYHCRGAEFEHILYRYVAQSGTEKLSYREPFWYNSGITPHIGTAMPDISEINCGLKTGLIVYGVGDHGGGPTRRDIELATAMADWPVFPTIKFGTFKEFFADAESVREKLPIINHELNYIFSGCYTSQSKIKQANKKSEKALADAEAINAFADNICNAPYYHKRFEKAWQNVTFTHFHDILTGSCIADSREHALGTISEATAIANTAYTNSMRAIAARIDTSSFNALPQDDISMTQAEGGGSAYSAGSNFGVSTRSPLYCISTPSASTGNTRVFNIFNMNSAERKENCEITVWDWGFDLSRIKMLDADMNEIDFQLMDEHPWKYWDHMFFRIIVPVSVPAFGYTTVVLTKSDLDEYPVYLNIYSNTLEKPHSNFVMENEHIRVEFDHNDAMIISMTDKKTGKELIRDGKAGLYIKEAEDSSSSAWKIGRYINSCPVSDCVKAELIEGKLRSILKLKYNVRNSEIAVEYSLDKDEGALRLKCETNWREITLPGEKNPVLVFAVPCNADKYIRDIPCGVLTADKMDIDIPCLNFLSAIDGKKSLTLACDSRYGYRADEKGLSVSLIHTQNAPDLYPEVCVQTVNIKLFIGSDDVCEIKNEAVNNVMPLCVVSNGIHEGELKKCDRFLEAEGKLFIHSVKKSEDGGIVVFLSNPNSLPEKLVLKTQREMKKAAIVNSLEKEIGKAEINNNVLSVTVGANKMLGIKFVTE